MMNNRDEMNEKCKEIARLTTGGTSAKVASSNHMTPLQAEKTSETVKCDD